MENPLATLRPLHAPPPVGWWPPAPGWWIVLLLVLVLIVAIYRHRRRRAPQRAALHELMLLKKNMNRVEQPVATLNQLLKRYALTCRPTTEVASLSGTEWLAFLDASGGNGQFSNGPGRLLLTGPFRNLCADPQQVNELIELARQWIKANRPQN